MSKAEKAGEPSMDEILASIRKIIAQDPAGVRSGPDVPDDSGSAGNAALRPLTAPKVTLDDVLGMADARPQGEPDRGSPQDARSPWPFSGPGGLTGSVGAPAARSAPGADSTRPFFAAPAPPAARTQRSGGDVPPTADAAKEPPAPQKPSDFSTIVPRRASDSEPQLGGPDRRPQQSIRVPEWLSRPAHGASGPSVPPPSATGTAEVNRQRPSGGDSVPAGERSAGRSPSAEMAKDAPARDVPNQTAKTAGVVATQSAAKDAELAAVSASDGSLDKSGSSAASGTAGATANAPAVPPTSHGVQGHSASPASAARVTPAAPAKVVAAPSDVGGAAPQSTGDQPGAPSPPAAMAAAGHVNGAGAGGNRTAPGASTPAIYPEKPASNAAKAVPVVEMGGTLQKPAVLGERVKVTKPGSQSDLVPTTPQSTGVRTLEDTVVDLLRPMIRQWLDDNMPRMVEKALRIELAASVKAKVDPSKH